MSRSISEPRVARTSQAKLARPPPMLERMSLSAGPLARTSFYRKMTPVSTAVLERALKEGARTEAERGHERGGTNRRGNKTEKLHFRLGFLGCAMLLIVCLIMTCACAGKTTRPGQPLGQPRNDPDNPPDNPPWTSLPRFFSIKHSICIPSLNIIFLIRAVHASYLISAVTFVPLATPF